MGEFERPRQYRDGIGGVLYDIVEFNTEVFATRTGGLTLGPAQLTCMLLTRKQGGRRSVFDDNFFGGLFDKYERRPLKLVAEEVPIRVLPLPEEGRPSDFSGVIGDFRLDMKVGPTSLRVGDPVTLKMTEA